MRPNDCSTHAYRWIQSCSSHTDRRHGARRTKLLCREVLPFHDVSLVVLKYKYKNLVKYQHNIHIGAKSVLKFKLK